MKVVVVSFVSGLVFAVGLAVSGMTQPSKVIGFLDVLGDWDPSLAFVMAGAIAVYLPVYRFIRNRASSLVGGPLRVPTRRDLNPRLILGAALFGVGWGLGGFCPGPGIVSTTAGGTPALVFVGAMIVGMLAFRYLDAATALVGRLRPGGTERPGALQRSVTPRTE